MDLQRTSFKLCVLSSGAEPSEESVYFRVDHTPTNDLERLGSALYDHLVSAQKLLSLHIVSPLEDQRALCVKYVFWDGAWDMVPTGYEIPEYIDILRRIRKGHHRVVAKGKEFRVFPSKNGFVFSHDILVTPNLEEVLAVILYEAEDHEDLFDDIEPTGDDVPRYAEALPTPSWLQFEDRFKDALEPVGTEGKDYRLVGSSCWIDVGDVSLYIRAVEGGVCVEACPCGSEHTLTIGSMTVFDEEARAALEGSRDG